MEALTLCQNREGEPNLTAIIMDAKHCTSEGPLSRTITGAYIAGYDLTKVVSRKDLTEERPQGSQTRYR